MSKKQKEIWKVYNDVFDQFTLRSVERLSAKGLFEELSSTVAIGKEANVFTARKKDGSLVCAKIYRLEVCDFNRMYEYIRQDRRFEDLKNNRRKVIFSWAKREYSNLFRVREMGISSPAAYGFLNNILVMELIGDVKAAPLLKNKIPEDLNDFFKKVVANMKLLWKNDFVHGDLSHYNIINHNENPVFIDFSHGTNNLSYNYLELWDRDVKNVAEFFMKHGISTDPKKLYKEITGKISKNL